MHLFKEENVQTIYPKRKPAKPVSMMLFLINALHSVTLLDPLGEKI